MGDFIPPIRSESENDHVAFINLRSKYKKNPNAEALSHLPLDFTKAAKECLDRRR